MRVFCSSCCGDDLLGSCVAGEELARACPSTFLAAITSATAFGRAVKRFGTEAQRERYLPSLAAGEVIGAFACTEAEAGSDLAGMQTTAEKQDGRWILNGEKDLVTNAPIADAFLVLAWTDRDAGLEQGMSLFLVDRSSGGADDRQTGGDDGSPRRPDLRHPSGELRGRRGGAPRRNRPAPVRARCQAVLEEIKLAISTLWVGIGVACMEESTRHAKAKKAFGKPIGLFEGVGAKLATMFTFNDIGRMMTFRAAWAMEQGDPEGPVLDLLREALHERGGGKDRRSGDAGPRRTRISQRRHRGAPLPRRPFRRDRLRAPRRCSVPSSPKTAWTVSVPPEGHR